MRYSYWLLRYVPDTLRGEMVNVGVLVGRDGGDWALRRVSSFRRAGRLGGDASRVRPWLEWLEREIDSYQRPALPMFRDERFEAFTSARVHRLQSRLNNAIQISEPTSVEGESAAETADFLYQFLVSEASVPSRSMTRRRLVTQLREQYDLVALSDVGRTLETRPQASAGLQRGRFDFAVVNEDVTQLSQVWSFDLADTEKLEQDIHAWSFLVTRLRDSGGVLGAKPGLFERRISPEVPISAVYQTPAGRRQQQSQMDVFFAAREAWTSLDVNLVPSSELDRVAHDALLPA
ncbi:DUF3037 domain-containing protein [Leifsonia sp. 2TAF2]|uniref:DUF3037 domain-containing protein n=1 Tax=Leifsonia sp. 2TAF2 TaxID=3233009 RepID=UPI003F9810C4